MSAPRAGRMVPLAIATLLAVTACSDSSPTGARPAGTPALVVLNAAQSPVDVLLDGHAVVQGLAPTQVSTRIDAAAGAHTVQLRSGGQTGAEIPVTISATHALAIAVTPGSGGTLDGMVLPDTAAMPVAGKSKLRVLHLASSTGELVIWRTQPDYQTPTDWVFPFDYGQSTDFLTSDPGTWEVRVWAKSDSTGSWDNALASMRLDIASGGVRTFAIVDDPNGGVKFVSIDQS